jgi:glutamate racemase
VFDSGIGGVSILRALRDRFPGEDFLYLADAGHGPYGDLDPGGVRERALRCAEVLAGQGAKALVVACNTATALAVEAIRARFPGPVVAVEPPLKPALADPANRAIGVLLTRAMADSNRYAALCARLGGDPRIHTRACPGLVERIEAGELDSAAGRAFLADLLAPLSRLPIDTLVLGCTHYAFAADRLREALGREVALLEPSAGVARHLRHRLAETGLLRGGQAGAVRFWASGDPRAAEAALHRIAGLERAEATGAMLGEFRSLAVAYPAAVPSA